MKNRAPHFTVLVLTVGSAVLLMVAPCVANAKDVTSEARAKLVPFLPVEVKASAEGDSQTKIGAGVLWALTEDVDATLVGSYQVSTKEGIATLLGASPGATSQSLPWSVALTASLTGVSPANDLVEPGQDHAITRALDSAYNQCRSSCAAPQTDDDQKFCKARDAYLERRASQWVRTLPPAKFCEAQQAAVAEADKEPSSDARVKKRLEAAKACNAACGNFGQPGCPLDLWPLEDAVAFPPVELCQAGQRVYFDVESSFARRFPPWRVRFGGSAGGVGFTYRAPAPTTPNVLTEQSTPPLLVGKIGLAASGILRRGAVSSTLEGLVNYRSDWTASTEKVSWCRPEGDVPLDDTDLTKTVPSKVCDEAVFKGPTHSNAVQAGLFTGWVDEAHGAWRLSVGPDIMLGTGKEQFRGTLKLNAYLRIASDSKENYSGLIRISPSVGFRILRDGTSESFGFIELAILGQRSMFSDEFDAL